MGNFEFKGTKGKWELYFDDRSLEKYIKTENKFIAKVGFGNEENNANALLISKAPEMLEMLQLILEGKCDIPDWKKEKARKLIKEATEL